MTYKQDSGSTDQGQTPQSAASYLITVYKSANKLHGNDDDDLVFYVSFNVIYVISIQWKGDERLSAIQCPTVKTWIPSLAEKGIWDLMICS